MKEHNKHSLKALHHKHMNGNANENAHGYGYGISHLPYIYGGGVILVNQNSEESNETPAQESQEVASGES